MRRKNNIEMDVDSSSSSDSEDQSMEPSGENETNDLVAGKIVKIHLENFLTHSEAIVHPNEQLNLVRIFLLYSFH